MEEEKAAAYYDELTRKGEGAARFKRGLGFSSADAVPQRASASFLTSFVRASSPTTASKLQKESQLLSIQNKLKKKPEREARSWRSEKHGAREGKSKKAKNDAVDYSRLIQGYDTMSAAERVKAKMKLQLAETVALKRIQQKALAGNGSSSTKMPHLDDEEIEVAEDDASLVKHIGQSFRFSAIEARREEQLKAAHDEAIFGTTASLSVTVDNEPEEENLEKDNNDNGVATGLLSEKVLLKQPGSWRDRVRKA
ncbi:hypothetical protein V6N12_013568 [Hibiscus sabdariffa]|uniref:Uncharacterized protein n=1 Tax=Hibiscus sabdariffa TaxID=183260 RepID=A0ABR2CBP7_9ROSI